MTAAAGQMAGMRCVAVLGGAAPELAEGRIGIDHILGLEPIWVGSDDTAEVEQVMAETTLRLSCEGCSPYEIALGGASAMGTLGYVKAAAEISSHAPLGSVVYTATGTGGTQSGLVVGFGHHDRVRGIDVGAVPGVAHRIDELVPAASEIGRAQVCTPVTIRARMPSSAWKKKNN